MEAKYKGLSNGIWYKVFKVYDYDKNIGLCKDGVWGQFIYCTFEKIIKSEINEQLYFSFS